MTALTAALFLCCAAVSPAVSPVPAAVFSPKDGQHYRYVIRQIRSDGAVQRTFLTERRVTFTRLGAGWRAELVLERTSQTAGGDVGSMFQAAMATLVGRPVRFDLDSAGAILGIDDLASLWAAAMQAIDAMLPPSGAGARRANTHALTARLRALSVARQQEVISSMLLPLIDPEGATRSAAVRTVSVPAISPTGVIDLAGTEAVMRDRAGIVSIETRATGAAAPVIARDVPGAEHAAAAPATLRIEALRRIDTATGLVQYRREINETCTTLNGPPSCVATVTEITLMSPVS